MEPSNPGIELRFPTLQEDCLPSESPGKHSTFRGCPGFMFCDFFMHTESGSVAPSILSVFLSFHHFFSLLVDMSLRGRAVLISDFLNLDLRSVFSHRPS